MTAITDALARWGAMKSTDLYAKIKDEVGSQRTFERTLRDTPGLLRLGSTRSRTYALRRPDVPPAEIRMRNEKGEEFIIGNLLGLEAGQWAFDHATWAKPWMQIGYQGEGTLPIYQGLPWFMEAFRPAGFLGKAWVRQHAEAHGWSLDVQSWTDDQVLLAATQEPWDWRGNLSVGPFAEVAANRVTPATRNGEYARLADLVMEGVTVGASADGEQPKFTALVEEPDMEPRAVIVKFTDRLTGDPAARRWADVMVTEAVASQVMALHGLDTARTEVWIHGDRLWLETTRFDRVGTIGRCGMVSLRALAASFNYQGPTGGWVGAVEHLVRRGVLDTPALPQAQHLATIGHLLLNNDMHMGNLSFIVGDGWPFPLTIAPVYDMTPMHWIPSIKTRVVPALKREPVYGTTDTQAMTIVAEIWEETSHREMATAEWRAWAADRAEQIRARMAGSLSSLVLDGRHSPKA